MNKLKTVGAIVIAGTLTVGGYLASGRNSISSECDKAMATCQQNTPDQDCEAWRAKCVSGACQPDCLASEVSCIEQKPDEITMCKSAYVDCFRKCVTANTPVVEEVTDAAVVD